MAVIDRFRNITTIFEVFEVPQTEVAQFIQGFSEFIQTDIKVRAGFVSYNLHLSEDGRVFNYGQWKSSSDYQSFLDDESLKDKRDHYYAKLVQTDATKVTFTT